MKTAISTTLLLAALTLGWLAGPSQAREPESASDAGMKPFRILLERNIFDPKRQPREPGEVSRPVVAMADTATTTPRLTLAGVLINNGEAVAFFEGTSPEYNAAVKLGGIIAGQQVHEIRTDRVLLSAKEHTLELPVAMQLSRGIKGDWEVTTATTPLAGTSSDSAKTTSDSGTDKKKSKANAGKSTPTGGSQDEIIKKLMERRRKEMGK